MVRFARTANGLFQMFSLKLAGNKSSLQASPSAYYHLDFTVKAKYAAGYSFVPHFKGSFSIKNK